MSSERTWHVKRLAIGLGAIAAVVVLYAALTSWRAERTADIALTDIRASLDTCSTALTQGATDSAGLDACSQALPKMREDTLRLNGPAILGQDWRSSRLIFLSLTARFLLPDTPEATEALAAFTQRAERILPWWQAAQPRLWALAAYDGAADMRGRSVLQEPDDFLYRLYRTKAALLLVRESMEAPEAVALGLSLPELGDALLVSDRLIRAVDARDVATAQTLRMTYLRTMASLAADAQTALNDDALQAQFVALAAQAKTVRAQLEL